mmetsp:Transcript_30475/g.76306  ORF Transcript_30475/g.76306 Transcript_30475/m.76306 type:complete len:251 (+) Transcript_30475:1794-2546(+)
MAAVNWLGAKWEFPSCLCRICRHSRGASRKGPTTTWPTRGRQSLTSPIRRSGTQRLWLLSQWAKTLRWRTRITSWTRRSFRHSLLRMRREVFSRSLRTAWPGLERTHTGRASRVRPGLEGTRTGRAGRVLRARRRRRRTCTDGCPQQTILAGLATRLHCHGPGWKTATACSQMRSVMAYNRTPPVLSRRLGNTGMAHYQTHPRSFRTPSGPSRPPSGLSQTFPTGSRLPPGLSRTMTMAYCWIHPRNANR